MVARVLSVILRAALRTVGWTCPVPWSGGTLRRYKQQTAPGARLSSDARLVRVVEAAVGHVRHVLGHAPHGTAEGLVALVNLWAKKAEALI